MQRNQRLSAVCKDNRFSHLTNVSISKFVLDRIFFSDKHKILFCQTPKVGNTLWKKVLMVVNGQYGWMKVRTKAMKVSYNSNETILKHNAVNSLSLNQ